MSEGFKIAFVYIATAYCAASTVLLFVIVLVLDDIRRKLYQLGEPELPRKDNR